MPAGNAAGHLADIVRHGRQFPVHLAQHLQIPQGVSFVYAAAGEQLVGYHDQLPTPAAQVLHAFPDGLRRIFSAAVGAVKLVGAEVADALQQHRATRRDLRRDQTGVALQGLKAFLGPHPPMFFDAAQALLVKWLHGGNVDPGSLPGMDHQPLRVFAFSAGGTAHHQCHHPLSLRFIRGSAQSYPV